MAFQTEIRYPCDFGVGLEPSAAVSDYREYYIPRRYVLCQRERVIAVLSRSQTQSLQTLESQECAECTLTRAHIAKHFPSHFERKRLVAVVFLAEDTFEFRGCIPVEPTWQEERQHIY